MNVDYDVEFIISLAKEIEEEDPIDWSGINVDRDTAYRLMALNVLELFGNKYDEGDRRLMMTATIIKLVVENFALNLQLRGGAPSE